MPDIGPYPPGRYVQAWPEGAELCPQCGQPDNCGDCNHEPLSDEEVDRLGGWFVPIEGGRNDV